MVKDRALLQLLYCLSASDQGQEAERMVMKQFLLGYYFLVKVYHVLTVFYIQICVLNHYNYFLHTYIVVYLDHYLFIFFVVKIESYDICCAINSVILMVSSTAHVQDQGVKFVSRGYSLSDLHLQQSSVIFTLPGLRL